MCDGHGHDHHHDDAGVGLDTRQAWAGRTGRRPGPMRVGIGGPVGSGKTALVRELCRAMRERWSIAVVTNDIYTREDADQLVRAGALEPERIVGVETGGCPHTAIREDASMNFAAIEELAERFPGLDAVLVESGGDNLAAAFSPELADVFVYVIDVAQGDDIPRKGGPGIGRSDVLLINKTDLARHVGVDLVGMEVDARRARHGRPVVLGNMRAREGVDELVVMLESALAARGELVAG